MEYMAFCNYVFPSSKIKVPSHSSVCYIAFHCSVVCLCCDFAIEDYIYNDADFSSSSQ